MGALFRKLSDLRHPSVIRASRPDLSQRAANLGSMLSGSSMVLSSTRLLVPNNNKSQKLSTALSLSWASRRCAHLRPHLILSQSSLLRHFGAKRFLFNACSHPCRGLNQITLYGFAMIIKLRQIKLANVVLLLRTFEKPLACQKENRDLEDEP